MQQFRNFNSIKVQLERAKAKIYKAVLFHFNSIKVQLERTAQPGIKRRSRFQFHKGTIRTRVSASTERMQAQFQFHKGTIRTKPSIISISRWIIFQFHKGTIRTPWRDMESRREADFNSIKVQLEPRPGCWCDGGEVDFNSIKVQLEHS